ncbi:hypothetical protein PI125_g14788 [Phytophthora idaei]|nr:hypothetical protein PI125_g14788 [Phytophthora idaei]
MKRRHDGLENNDECGDGLGCGSGRPDATCGPVRVGHIHWKGKPAGVWKLVMHAWQT